MANLCPNLLPCPFCGGAAELRKTPNMHMIECVNADCSSNPDVLQVLKHDAIAAWNRRATPPSPSTAPTKCTCPSGLGSLSWPCPEHPPSTAPEVDERAAFEAWAGVQYRNIARYSPRDHDMGLTAWKAGRAALASRPAEVDDEGLPPLRTPEFCAGDLESGEPVYTAEQYRQGQRDAVAADRTRRGGQP
ncbi:Lar family restriction alleviation protein [Massilia timonae]|uniref:Lar family restriction alleviation protein n=1 Tax=Massilia timonae TaxID=47229 RepID=UPI0028D6F62C|nr:Lar family restriction alleviation protein [Massilia timonae]